MCLCIYEYLLLFLLFSSIFIFISIFIMFFCLLSHLKMIIDSSGNKNHAVVIAAAVAVGSDCFSLLKFTFGMGFLCRVYQDCRHLFDMFHSCRPHFDSVNHSNVNLIKLVVSDCLGLRVALDVKFLQQPVQMKQKYVFVAISNSLVLVVFKSNLTWCGSSVCGISVTKPCSLR